MRKMHPEKVKYFNISLRHKCEKQKELDDIHLIVSGKQKFTQDSSTWDTPIDIMSQLHRSLAFNQIAIEEARQMINTHDYSSWTEGNNE